MKSLRLFVATLFLSVLAVPVFSMASASAQTGGAVLCLQEGPIVPCDLGIKKEVSVNGGAYSDANSEDEAGAANVGDEVTWRITVNKGVTPFDRTPIGTVTVGDNLPAGVTYVSSSTSDGSTYDQSSDIWQFTLDGSTSYPVTLTINTTAANTGPAPNFAWLSFYACDDDSVCEDSFGQEGEYSDSNRENDGDWAGINISAKPVVLGESTPVVLAATGSGTTESLVAAALIGTTLLTLGYSRFARKQN